MEKTEKAAKNQLFFIILVAAIVSVVSFAVAFTVSQSKTASLNRCEGICVALRDNKADPDTVSVKAGTYVQFNSADGKTHNLSLGKGGEEHSHTGKFSSGDFGADEAWRVQFKEEGSFLFHDHFNPKINVLVVVYTPGKDYKIE